MHDPARADIYYCNECYLPKLARPCDEASEMEILVVDDDRLSAAVLRRILEQAGHQVTAAEDGEEAWQILDDPSRFFDAVLVDLAMPVVDGFELIRRVRESSVLSGVQLIVCTASHETLAFREAVRLGIQHYLIKPVSPERVLRRLAAVRPRKVSAEVV